MENKNANNNLIHLLQTSGEFWQEDKHDQEE